MIATLLLVAACMALQDLLSTGLVVAEARNLGRFAGALDALGDVASRVGTVVTAGLFAAHGWSAQVFAALAVTCATSYLTTSHATAWAHQLLDRYAGPGRTDQGSHHP